MKVCPKCNDAFNGEFTSCEICGSELTDGPEKTIESNMNKKLRWSLNFFAIGFLPLLIWWLLLSLEYFGYMDWLPEILWNIFFFGFLLPLTCFAPISFIVAIVLAILGSEELKRKNKESGNS